MIHRSRPFSLLFFFRPPPVEIHRLVAARSGPPLQSGWSGAGAAPAAREALWR